jgi:glycosyltransferase involved in cell wall biosynthesis
MPTVSVIVPAYNAARFVVASLESVVNQTFSDFEVIVVDDGSTDETAALVQPFARRDGRFRLMHRPNGGIAAARNTALTEARGEFIALLDSDDLWMPVWLERQLGILRHRPDIGVLSANCLNLGSSADGKPLKPVGHGAIIDLTLLDLIRFEDSVCIQSVFRRAVPDAIGWFDASFRSSEDYDFWLRAAAGGFRVSFNPTPLGYYRRRPDSVSSDLGVMLGTITRCLHKARAECIDHPEVVRAIDQKLMSLRRQTLLESAKQALGRGDHEALKGDLTALHQLTGAWQHAAAAWLSRAAPEALAWAYTLKRMSRRILAS